MIRPPRWNCLRANGSSTICQASSFKYPIDVYYASGALVGTTMVSCGGLNLGKDTAHDSCYKFDKKNNQWTFLSNMSSPRLGSAAISIHNGVWITGGRYGGNDLSSTEFIFLNGTKKDGPSLQPTSSHCLVQYKGTIILTGGIRETRSIVIYRQVKEAIEEIGNGPDMTNDRVWHGCGIFHSSQHGGIIPGMMPYFWSMYKC